MDTFQFLRLKVDESTICTLDEKSSTFELCETKSNRCNDPIGWPRFKKRTFVVGYCKDLNAFETVFHAYVHHNLEDYSFFLYIGRLKFLFRSIWNVRIGLERKI